MTLADMAPSRHGGEVARSDLVANATSRRTGPRRDLETRHGDEIRKRVGSSADALTAEEASSTFQKQVRKQLHPQANCSLISPHLALLDALDQAQVGSKVHSSGPRGVRTETTLELALLSPGSSQGINALRAIESPRADPALQVGLH